MPELGDTQRALLEGRYYATLATHNEDGSIHLTPVWYIFQDGQLYVGTFSASRKARNVSVRPSASLLVEIRKPGCERWVSASGRADILTGEESRRINSAILNRYLTEEARNHPTIGPTFATLDDVTIRIVPAKWRSWEAKALDDQFFGGILGVTPGKWFRDVD